MRLHRAVLTALSATIGEKTSGEMGAESFRKMKMSLTPLGLSSKEGGQFYGIFIF